MLPSAPIFLTVPLLTAGYFDCRERRIPNVVTLPLFAAGLALQGCFYGISGLTNSLLGAAAGGGLYLVLYFFNAMGAGDVKLGAAVGSWLGIRFAAVALFYTVLIGGLMAVYQLFFHWRTDSQNKKSSEDVEKTIKTLLPRGKSQVKRATLPYGIAIAGGAFALFFKFLWETRP